MNAAPGEYTEAAIAFARALTSGDFAAAYGMTSREYRRGTSLGAMQTAYEALVPAEFGPVSSVEVGLRLDSWPEKEPTDVSWVYVSIGGDVFSEAVIVVVTTEDGALRLRDVQFGRP